MGVQRWAPQKTISATNLQHCSSVSPCSWTNKHEKLNFTKFYNIAQYYALDGPWGKPGPILLYRVIALIISAQRSVASD